MNLRPAALAKSALTRAGARLPDTTISGLRVATGYLAVGKWVASNGWSEAPRVASRNRVFDAMMAEIGDDSFSYLEFGVWEGASLRYWVDRMPDARSEFHGFDSFEGLPETFDAVYGAGHFDKGGKTPDIADPRVKFHVGWFEETLPSFDVPLGKRIVITLDADLYSATKLVLQTLDEHIVPGTLVYFDELSRIDHEPAAFDDYRRSSGKVFEPIALERSLNTGAFICR
jgi:hypothetical protein